MTTTRVISEVNAKKSQECFIKWMQDCNVITNRRFIVVYGKLSNAHMIKVLTGSYSYGQCFLNN